MSRHLLYAELQLEAGADERAPGGAVTIALCGHWDHAGECRWPHFNQIKQQGNTHLLTVEFSCCEQDYSDVVSRISNALECGKSTGPDGVCSKWRLIRIDETPSAT